MTRSHMLTPEPHDPIWGWIEAECEGTLTEDQGTLLNLRLSGDETARRFYVRYMNVHARLLWLSRGKNTSGLPSEADSRRAGGISPLLIAPEENRGLTPPARQGTARLARYRLRWLAAAVAASLLVGVIYLSGWLRQAAQPESPAPVVAHLVRTVQAVWADDSRNVPSHQRNTKDIAQAVSEPLKAGHTLRLHSGLAEIEYTSGARVVLQGPVEFVVGEEKRQRSGGRDPKSAFHPSFLSHGKLTAHVPPQGAGFTIASPTLTAVDRGTEFGMVVQRKGAGVGDQVPGGRDQGKVSPTTNALTTEVHVLSGKVEVAAETETATSEVRVPQSAIPNPHSEIVSAGSAVRVDQQGTLQPTPVNPDEFFAGQALLSDREVVQDDDFNDGDLTRNLDGIGGGFDLLSHREPSTTAKEVDGAAQLSTVEGRRLWKKTNSPLELRSRDRFSVGGASFKWHLRAAPSPHVVMALVSDDEQSQVEVRIYSSTIAGQPNELRLTAWNDPNSKVEYMKSPCEEKGGKPLDWTRDVVLALETTAEGYTMSWQAPGGIVHRTPGRWKDRAGFDFQQFAGAGRKVQMRIRCEPTRGVASALLLDKVEVTDHVAARSTARVPHSGSNE
ncbi:MAG: hypothetical protein K8T91_26745 [Planctomycetes bacterium]|nr:hypothetical protein [Planctomycetota bacterium]